MPLLTEEKLHNAASWAIWHIEEEEETFLHQLSPGPAEQVELALIKQPKRRLEWLASRVLIKQLASQHHFPHPEIIKDKWGKPRLSHSSFHISISHSFPYAAAILHEQQPVGIDIEHPRSQLLRIQHKFLNAPERLCAAEDPRKLCVYWAAKEAIYKRYGKRALIFQEQILIQPFELDNQGELQGELLLKTTKENHTLHYRYIEDLLVCFSL